LFEVYLNKLKDWVNRIDYVAIGWEVLVLVLAVIGAITVHRTLGRYLLDSTNGSGERTFRHITLRSIQRVVFPLSLLLGALVGRAILTSTKIDVTLLNFIVPLMLSLAIVRLVVYALRKALRPGPAVKAWENLISTSIWLLVALHLVGWLPDVIHALDAFGYSFGDLRISLYTMLQLGVAVGALLVMATWLSSAIEQGLSRSSFISPGVRIGLVKTSKFGLYTLAALISLSAVGINLGALAVFGGALGVGLGCSVSPVILSVASSWFLTAPSVPVMSSVSTTSLAGWRNCAPAISWYVIAMVWKP